MQTPAPVPPIRHARHRHVPPRRWVGALWCLTDGCDTVLAEVFADEVGLTYLQPVGGGRLRSIGVPCPRCGAVRDFASSPAGGGLSAAEKASRITT